MFSGWFGGKELNSVKRIPCPALTAIVRGTPSRRNGHGLDASVVRRSSGSHRTLSARVKRPRRPPRRGWQLVGRHGSFRFDVETPSIGVYDRRLKHSRVGLWVQKFGQLQSQRSVAAGQEHHIVEKQMLI